MNHTTTIAVIGAGAVGTTTAYALLLKNLASEILLVDKTDAKAEGEVLDLQDAIPFSETSEVCHATLKEASKADILIITAGAHQKPEQTRLDLLEENKKVLESIATGLGKLKKDAIILLVSNPVDALTCYAQKLFDLPKSQIFGSGTLLDSQRLRGFIAQELQVAQRSVHAYVLGEHGNSQFVPWGHATLFGEPLIDILSEEKRKYFETKAMNKAYEIIDKKGATFYGIASCVAHICESIIFDQKLVMPVSSYHEHLGVCLSLPVVIGKNGIEKDLTLHFTEEEMQKLLYSAEILKKNMSSTHI